MENAMKLNSGQISDAHADLQKLVVQKFNNHFKIDWGRQGGIFLAIFIIFFGVFGTMCNIISYSASGNQINLVDFDSSQIIWLYRTLSATYWIPAILFFGVGCFLTFKEDLPLYGLRNALWMVPVTNFISFIWYWVINGFSNGYFFQPFKLLILDLKGWVNNVILLGLLGIGAIFGWVLRYVLLKYQQKHDIVLNIKSGDEAKQNPLEYLTLPELFNKSPHSIKQIVMFLILPGFHIEEINRREYEIEQTKSKRRFFRRLLNPLTILGVILISYIIMMATFPQWLTPYTFDELTVTIHPGIDYIPPTSEHPFGTTSFGWDVRGRLFWGARQTLTVGLSAILIAVITGVIIGTISAYFGGVVDTIIMRFFDLMMAFPGLIFVFIIVATFGQSMDIVLVAFGILGIPNYARFVRASVLQVKQSLYIEAARISGASNFKIMFKHILPNAISPIIIMVSFDFGSVILGLASLNFLGLTEGSLVDWGTDIGIGRRKLLTAPWVGLWPGVFIFLAVLGFMLLGDGLRDALDPNLKVK